MRHALRPLAVFVFVFFCCVGRGLAAQSESSAPQNPSPSPSSATPAATALEPTPASPPETIVIPGPLRSFLRMAGISQQIPNRDVLPMLARNVALWGHETGRETEFLILLSRYVQYARELESLAGPDSTIRVADCGDAARLLPILGYQFEASCGTQGASLITGNAERAFLTLDSGFPLTTLEQDLEKHVPFSYPFPGTDVPVLFSEKDWVALAGAKHKGTGDLLDMLLHDDDVDRLYTAMSHLDPESREALVHAPGMRRLLTVSSTFDFYGSQLSIRSGHLAVPGGASAEKAWAELVGANPSNAGEFVWRLFEHDRGWLAAYFDALARVSPAQQAFLTQDPRLRSLYTAYRSAVANDYAYAGVFPKNAELLLLFTRLRWDSSGEPLVPGDPGVWKDIFDQRRKTSDFHNWSRHMPQVDSPEHLLEGLVYASNVETDIGPLQVYLSLSAMDAGRQPGKQLSPATARLLAANFVRFNYWYSIFAEFPSLDDTSIGKFIAAADNVDKISNQALRANALGSFQADIGLWQIFARQGQIPANRLNPSWQEAIHPFAAVASEQQLFDAARGSLSAIVVAAGAGSSFSQDQIVDLLAGPSQSAPEARRVHQELAHRIGAVLEDQHLVSLDTLFGLYDGLNQLAHGAHVGDNLLLLAGDLREFELPRPIFTEGEKTSWSPVIYTNRHAELQIRTDLTSVIRTPGTPAQLEAARGRLTPFLRDTLVGLNYAYYEPPGAQVLHSNPLFVRSHDFSTVSVQGVEEIWGPPELIGIGVTAGGGAYLMGSLADLPYALASVEQDFIAPENVQALIWKETVPQLLVDAVIPRWWNISPAEMHAIALYQRAGEELLAAASTHPDLRRQVLSILAGRINPQSLNRLEISLGQPEASSAPPLEALPAVTFYLASAYRRQFPDQAGAWGPAGKELDELARRDPQAADPERLARDFGVPHPEMEQSDACGLIETGLFPVSGGYTSRLFGESWQSTNLYWARLADEMGYSPVMLNLLVPQLTREMIVNIFATNIDDWPALYRAMQQTGEEFKKGRLAGQAATLAHGQ
jgi:hypothetical protein